MDPNKYSKNADLKPDSTFDTIKSVVSMILMVLGIAGLSIDMFREGGLLGKLVDTVFRSTTSMLLIPLIIGVLWLINRMISSADKGGTKKSGNLPMFLMVLVGAYYAFRLATTGGL